LVTLSEIQKGLVAEKATPQGSTRLGSVTAARPGMSETRSIWAKLLARSEAGETDQARRATIEAKTRKLRWRGMGNVLS
jgi:hypothetical protein